MLILIQWNSVQTKLAGLFIAGRERLCSHCRNLFNPHQRKLYMRGSVGTNLDDSVGSKKEPPSHHCILCSLSFPEKKSLLPDFEHLKAERLSGSTLALGKESGKGNPWTSFPLWQTCSAFSSLYRQNNWFSLWKVQYLIKNSCTFLRFISIFIWISKFPDVFKYFQGKVCSDNKYQDDWTLFLQFLLSIWDLLLKKSNHYRVEKNFRKLWKSLLFNIYFGLKFSKTLLRFF